MNTVVTMEAVLTLRREASLSVAAAAGSKTILNGRPAGAELFDKVIKHLDGLPTERVVPLSFKDIEFLDYSCADEFLAKILRRIRSGELEGKFIVLQEVTPTVLENIEMALKERDCCCPVLDDAGHVRIVGKISEPLLRTYRFSRERRTITTGDVQDYFKHEDLGTSAASNRLVALCKMGLLYKVQEGPSEHGGRQYVYEAVA